MLRLSQEMIAMIGSAAALAMFFAYMSIRTADRMDQRFEAFQHRMDQRFDAFEKSMDQGFDALEEGMDQRFDALDQRFDAFEESLEAAGR